MNSFLINSQIYIIGASKTIDDLSLGKDLPKFADKNKYSEVYNNKALVLFLLTSPLFILILPLYIVVGLFLDHLLKDWKYANKVDSIMKLLNTPLYRILDICENLKHAVNQKPTRDYYYWRGSRRSIKICLGIMRLAKKHLHRFEKIILKCDEDFDLEDTLRSLDVELADGEYLESTIIDFMDGAKEEVLVLKLSGLKE